MEGHYYLVWILLIRIVLPLALAFCVIIRQNLFSFLYLILFYCVPFLRADKDSSTKVTLTSVYLIVTFTMSVVIFFAQVAYQITLRSMNYSLKNCDSVEKILRHIGFLHLKTVEFYTIICIISPELIILVTSGIAYSVYSKVVVTKTSFQSKQNTSSDLRLQIYHHSDLLLSFGKFVILFSLLLAAAIQPSIPAGIYFLAFIGTMTYWAWNKKLTISFTLLLASLILLIMFHIAALFTVQLQWVQEFLLPKYKNYIRYFGLIVLVTRDCSNPQEEWVLLNEISSYLNPLILLWLYYICALQLPAFLELYILEKYNLRKSRESQNKSTKTNETNDSQNNISGDNQEIMSSDSSTSENIFEEKGSKDANKVKSNWHSKLIEFIAVPYTLISSFSYIGTNIIMMVWSITYHSWLAFVFLIWAVMLWISSHRLQNPHLLLFYSIFLLISQYVFSMDLKENELPDEIIGINLHQIGFKKPTRYAAIPILVKSLYTCMFWIYLRFHIQERQKKPNDETENIIQIIIETGQNDQKQFTQSFNSKLSIAIRFILVKYWIWLVALLLFVKGISGEEMTAIRIAYMIFFVIFIVAFQVSHRLWRRMSYCLLVTIIALSKVVLIIIYTYQFDGFPEYWHEYLGLSEDIQAELGLEIFRVTEFFIRLLLPTLIIIVATIQLNYLHKDFRIMYGVTHAPKLSIPANNESSNRNDTSSEEMEDISNNEHRSNEWTNIPHNNESYLNNERRNAEENQIATTSYVYTVAPTKEIPHGDRQKPYLWWKRIRYLLNRFLELYLSTILIVCIALTCVYNASFIHFILLLCLMIGSVLGRKPFFGTMNIINVVSAFLIVLIMSYQMSFIEVKDYELQCTSDSKPLDIADWFGFKKISSENSLFNLLQNYIGIVLLATIMSAIEFGKLKNEKESSFTLIPNVMFPEVTRSCADKSLILCFKYICNYLFYKFGIEITLITTAVLISLRMDMYGALYGLWLLIMFSVSRKTIARIWKVYHVFVMVIITVQYCVQLGLPPGVCVILPWQNSEVITHLFNWIVKPYPLSNLGYDFILLYMIYEQQQVFNIENDHSNQEYAGGTNESIISLLKKKEFINTVPYFTSSMSSPFNIVKNIVFHGFLWLALACYFWSGVKHINIFSIGYLSGAFIFLWKGGDIYMFPLTRIIKWWNYLLAYNVLVILAKTILQIVECIFVKEVQIYACSVFQLTGIGCKRKFYELVPDEDCPVQTEFIGIEWDVISFALILILRRLFNSHYILHVIIEGKASNILDTRGVILMNKMRMDRIAEQQEKEEIILNKIKIHVENIKSSQHKSRKHREPSNHYEAIRSGDYYMFEELDDLPIIDIIEDEGEMDASKKYERRLTLGEFIAKAMKDDMETAAELALSLSSSSLSSSSSISSLSQSDQRISSNEHSEEFNIFSVFTDSQPEQSRRTHSQRTYVKRIQVYVKILWALINSVMISLKKSLNKFSRDYRYIKAILTEERKTLKENEDFRKFVTRSMLTNVELSKIVFDDISARKSSLTQKIIEEKQEEEMARLPVMVSLLVAIYYAIMSKTDILCYFMIFLLQIHSASIISLLLPLFVCLWGILSKPYPDKTFWVTLFAYTETMIVIKCIFNLKVLPWADEEVPLNNPLHPSRIIGIEEADSHIIYDLCLLLALFLHRYNMKSLGTWRSVTEECNTFHQHQKFRIPLQEKRSYTMNVNGNEEKTHKNKEETDTFNRNSLETASLILHKEIQNPFVFYTKIIKTVILYYISPLRQFFEMLLTVSRVSADVYVYMLLCDIFNLIVTIFGFYSFSASDRATGGVFTYIEENKIPLLFFVVLFSQFILIIIDRAIYLKKSIIGRLIFHIILTVLIHTWLFFIHPATTERRFFTSIPPQLWYIAKCFYLLLSAHQIRSGYPKHTARNVFCKRYNISNFILFKMFMSVPFLFELRTIMDWMMTKTSMNLFEWLKMEDIYNNVFQIKCMRRMEKEYPQLRGHKKNALSKYILGGIIVFILITIIWLPIAVFSMEKTVGIPATPSHLDIILDINSYESLYSLTAQTDLMKKMSHSQWIEITNLYKTDKEARTFLSYYSFEDVAVLVASGESSTVWNISPPSRRNLIQELNSKNTIVFRFTWIVSRYSRYPQAPEITGDTLGMKELVMESNDPQRLILLQMISGEIADESVHITLKEIFPKFIEITNHKTALAVPQLMNEIDSIQDTAFVNISLSIAKDNDNKTFWWKLKEESCNNDAESVLDQLPFYSDCQKLVIYTFSEKIFPLGLRVISQGSIIMYYITFGITCFSLARTILAGMSFRIPFEDLPCADRILQLCLDLYLVREHGEFVLEEDLYARLIFLYRSPETLIRWSRYPEDMNE